MQATYKFTLRSSGLRRRIVLWMDMNILVEKAASCPGLMECSDGSRSLVEGAFRGNWSRAQPRLLGTADRE